MISKSIRKYLGLLVLILSVPCVYLFVQHQQTLASQQKTFSFIENIHSIPILSGDEPLMHYAGPDAEPQPILQSSRPSEYYETSKDTVETLHSVSDRNKDVLQQITFILDVLNIGSNDLAGLILDSINRNAGCRFHIENLKGFFVFKIKIDTKFYILKQLAGSRDYNINDLLITNFDSPYIANIISAFRRDSYSGESVGNTWYVSEYLDVPIFGDCVMNGGIAVLRTIAHDMLEALECVHSKRYVHQDLFARNVAGKTEPNN
ncbi:uncharacterized protein VICG_02104, partial [Vittaforma corneae ATCC 50505]